MLGLSTATPRRFTTALTVLGLLTAGATLQASVATPAAAATTHRVLFDNAHAETAGNASRCPVLSGSSRR